MKILGIITARGGSKGVPGKNIKPLGGKPLIAYTIEAAKESGIFDRIILSTDDEKIAEVGKTHGVDVPFMRPANLAEDTTPTLPVLVHVVQWLKDTENYEADAVMLLQPTTPLRRAEHMVEARELFEKSGADSVVSLKEVPGHYNPHWQFQRDDADHLRIFTGEPFEKIITRRQELPNTYTRNGAIYLFRPSLLFATTPSFYGSDVRGYVMDDVSSINIDTLADFAEAERFVTLRT